jgi:RNA polymerase sigma-54 factor
MGRQVQANLSQDFRLSQRLSLKQTLSLDILQLPLAELREKIQLELERNPALEVVEDRSEVSLDELYAPKNESDDYFEASSDSGFLRGGALSDEKRRFIEGAPNHDETLQESLLWQLRLTPLENDVRRAGEVLIQNLDADGFNIVPPEQLFAPAVLLPAVWHTALELVRRLVPAGCCTSGYMESLAVQARLFHAERAADIEKLLPFLEELERGKFAAAAKKTGLDDALVPVLFDCIKTLSPFPGRSFDSGSEGRARFVVPDIQVVFKNNARSIILNDEEIPVLGIAPFFLKQHFPKGAARDFVEENVKEARWFMHSINRRNHTLLRVTRAVVEYQKNFFLYGPKFLAPLSLRDLAGELGIHETTVSRTVNGKYVQTSWGIFELRRFFTNSISGAGSGGSSYSKAAVKEILKEIVEAEARTLSDAELARQLKERGIEIARRTVAKYRAELDLASSYRR